ncbi:Aerobic cobaltochelatase subunit CobT [Candidatus Hodgkinia cicadicola]|uniref:Aerobic cobaltochelatase subunit CobT n=1 Tax=Candidatus Hodgkinia cicadicola TaxID=573658 RepID=A0ABX4MIA8_9HYPH|nr:Aerobic cobaltochelatase subunit CobT [Candidatus Hodgkinia cicadicola]PIM96608.1 Aerobic cobaltochelatase subunit CobT [Candidatus Hodgkinia cicadicola]
MLPPNHSTKPKDNRSDHPHILTKSLKYKSYTNRFDKILNLTKNIRTKAYETAKTIQVINKNFLHYAFYNLSDIYTRYNVELKQNPTKLRLIIDKSLSTSNKFTLVTKFIKHISALFNDIEIICYTTRHWMGGNSLKYWEQTKFSQPGRINDLLHIKYNHENELHKEPTFKKVYHYNPKENIDGETLLKFCSRYKTNILICDNNPADYTTTKLNKPELLNHHMNNTIKLLNKTNIKILKININKTNLYNWFNLNKHTSKETLNNLITQLMR